MRCRVIVVVWSVCLCITANLGIYVDKRQMMGTNVISRVWRSFKKRCFSKNASFKSYGVIYILWQLIYVNGSFCDIFTKANTATYGLGML